MFIIENDIRNLLTDRDLKILIEFSSTQDGQDYLSQRVRYATYFVKSKIQHRFDPAQIFIDVNMFDIASTYAVDDFVYYTETDYDNTTSYVVGERVSYNNYIYECILGSTGNLPTNATYWTRVIRDKQYFTSIAASTGIYPDDVNFFTEGDIRDELMVEYVTKIAVYELFKKMQPNNVPQWIVVSREETVEHLNRIARGLDTVDLPIYEDTEQGQEIVYNFNFPAQDNSF